MATKLFVALSVVLLAEFAVAAWGVNRYLDRTNARLVALEQQQCSCITLLIPGAAPSDPAFTEESAR